MNEITILTYSYGSSPMGSGSSSICLLNFVRLLNEAGYAVNVFSILESLYSEAKTFKSINKAKEAIDRSFVVHHWSGMNKAFASLCLYAKKNKKKVILGPNLFDGLDFLNEKNYLNNIKYDKILITNECMIYKLSKNYEIPIDKINVFAVGPILSEWSSAEKDNFILWKGNAKSSDKDVKFALELAKRLRGKYNFKFLGHPRPYKYEEHIKQAKMAKLYISTSTSEVTGLALAEQWAAGTPSVTHPKIYQHGKNYKTGIIANKTLDDYIEAIEEIMDNEALWVHLSNGAIEYSDLQFNPERLLFNYFNKILGVNQ